MYERGQNKNLEALEIYESGQLGQILVLPLVIYLQILHGISGFSIYVIIHYVIFGIDRSQKL
jgi:hypothetical protein